ncbi:MAG: biopolymer transporter ExbD [candidate division WOR-3 bacterium]|nr:biopolymer transporter ExbD [candidate division WOR-3 bacterium]
MAEHKEKRDLDIQKAITPMAGMALIVVVMMMMTATQLLTHEETPVEVPRANTMERKTEDNLTIALIGTMYNPEDRKLYLNDSLMPLPYIERRIQQKMSEDPFYLIVIRADKSAPSQWVMDLLTMVKGAGAQRIALSTKRVKTEEATSG